MDREQQVIMGFRDLLNKMAWLNKSKMEHILKDYKPSEVHCMEYIEENEDSNVTKLATSLYMTTSAISKLTKKLIKKGFVESYKRDDNKKEVCFRLTREGKAINKVHKELHKEFWERDKVIFEQITEEQFNDILNFIEKYGKHLDIEIMKQGLNIKSE